MEIKQQLRLSQQLVMTPQLQQAIRLLQLSRLELVDEVRFDDLSRNPSHVPAYSGWAFRDISDVKYKNRLNSKGLVTFAGYKKDAFYYFKSQFGAVPVVHLVGSTYFLRGGTGVKAYSNAATLTLTATLTLMSRSRSTLRTSRT